MAEHKATVKWARGGKDFTYKTYSRDHVWIANGNEIPASATPNYFGNPDRVDPETALVAALSSCHMLTFLALAANKGFVVESYEDAAVGHLEKNAQGKLAITRVELNPRIEFAGGRKPDAAALEQMHDEAHHGCFIANSVLTEVTVKSPAAD